MDNLINTLQKRVDYLREKKEAARLPGTSSFAELELRWRLDEAERALDAAKEAQSKADASDEEG